MADPRYEIASGIDLTPGLSMLLQARKASAAQKLAQQNADTQAEFARNTLKREAHRDYMERMTFERGEQDRRDKAFESAQVMFGQGNKSGALSLLQRHGINATPEMGAPTTTPAQLLTPAQVLAGAPQTPQEPPEPGMPGSPFEGPQAPPQAPSAAPPMTPAGILSRAYQGEYAGASVPEEQPAPIPVAPPDMAVGGQGPGHAVEDLMPMELEPAHTTPGAPSGAYSFKGPGGADMGRFDPGEQKNFNRERATAVRGMLEHPTPQAVAEAVAMGYIPVNEGNAMLKMIQSGEAATARVNDREDKQTFTREENDKYRNEGVKIADRDRWETGRNAARIGSARVGQMNPLKVDTANRQDMGTLRAGFKEWKNTVNLAIDSKSHKRLATAMANLESGNAMQQREAAESLVSIFKGGGQVTKASQDLLLHHLAGYVGDAQSWLQKAESGHFGARELDVLKNATRSALTEETERLHSLHESAVDSFGPGSGYEQLGGNVNAMVKGAFKQFGYDAPDIYQQAPESVVLGSGKRPATPKPGAKPAGPKQTVTIRNKKTGETKEVSLEEARKMGAAP